MKTYWLCIVALSFVFLNEVQGYDCKLKTTPKWSNSYTVQGVLMIPYAELREPFTAWYDAASKKSRIDYYGDMVKTYQLSDMGSFGSSIKIAPMTTEEKRNQKTCLQVNGTENNAIEPQSILPDLEKFGCEGNDTYENQEVEKWVFEQTIGQKSNKYTILIKYVVDQTTNNLVPVPVKYEMKGYNSLLGSHYDHYYLVYNNYDSSDLPAETFKIDPSFKCTSFPGPGDRHIYTFNPMKEFVYPESESHVDFEFDKFKHKHGKDYVNEKEHAHRREIFKQNVRYIHSVNRQGRGYSLGVNHLSDKTDLELKALRGKQYTEGYNGGQPFPYTNAKLQKLSLPESWDWRIYGAVTPVKDQSVCGSCWSFGTVGAIEGAYFLKTNKLVRLSQQALIDCSWGFGNNGCDGGEDFRVYQWMLKHGGIPTEESYGPYLGQDGYCHAEDENLVAKIDNYYNVTPSNEGALRLAIFKHGPVSVAIDASQKTFSFYSNGVYYEPKCGNRPDQLDHAVLAVGYGSLNGKNYWLVKNSWSNYWGNDGYILMSSKDNNCGVMTTPTYVTMNT